MPRIVKPLIYLAIGFLVYMAIAISIPYIRFYHIKGKMKEAAENAFNGADDTIARALAENALDDKLPLVGDYFYRVEDEQGKLYVCRPESEEQKKEYLEGARQYFLDNIVRDPGNSFTISIGYTVELYFPMYTHKINFSHKEIQPLAR
jgi:hypothetical protein